MDKKRKQPDTEEKETGHRLSSLQDQTKDQSLECSDQRTIATGTSNMRKHFEQIHRIQEPEGVKTQKTLDHAVSKSSQVG